VQHLQAPFLLICQQMMQIHLQVVSKA